MKNPKHGDLSLKISIFVTAHFRSRNTKIFRSKSEKLQKSIKFEYKMVDNHWEQLVFGYGYQFWSFSPIKCKKKQIS